MFSTLSTLNSNLTNSISNNCPKNITLTAISDTNITISFSPPPRIDVSINSYTSNTVLITTGVIIQKTGITGNTSTITGLSSSTNYKLIMNALYSNGAVSQISKPLFFKTINVITGLVSNYDANVNITLANTNYVSVWYDTNNIKNASQSNISMRPLYITNGINTHNVIDFGSVTGSILLTNNTAVLTTDITIFFVLQKTSSSTGFSQFFSTQGIWTTGAIACILYNGILQLSLNGTADWVTTYTPALNTPFILMVNYTSATGSCVCSYKINGNNAVSNTLSATSQNINAYFEIGNWSQQLNLRTFTGNIGNVIWYNRTLTTTEIQQMEGNIAWNFSLQNNLPTNHPYYSVRPTVSI
jgi:hypothetical protein